MPRCFDKIGSVRLAQLLSPKQGWKMQAFADERQHVQTREEVGNSASIGEPMDPRFTYKVWPAGRFVRRSWVSDRSNT